jgi:hypothetical protein
MFVLTFIFNPLLYESKTQDSSVRVSGSFIHQQRHTRSCVFLCSVQQQVIRLAVARAGVQ